MTESSYDDDDDVFPNPALYIDYSHVTDRNLLENNDENGNNFILSSFSNVSFL